MTSVIHSITFDCADAKTLAEFWSGALERPIDQSEPAPSQFFASIGRDDGSDQIMMFIAVPEGKEIKNRVHLDLRTDDRATEVERLVALGAAVVHDKDEWGTRWTTLTDPEGNEFCVAEH